MTDTNRSSDSKWAPVLAGERAATAAERHAARALGIVLPAAPVREPRTPQERQMAAVRQRRAEEAPKVAEFRPRPGEDTWTWRARLDRERREYAAQPDEADGGEA